MHQQVLDGLIVQQVVGETHTVLQAEYLMDAGIAEIRIDEQHSLRGLHGETHSQIHGSQRFSLAMPGTGDSQHIPVIFSKAMHDLGPQNLKGIDEGTFVVRSHHPPLTKQREWNIQ
jgi:hypothetical protein